MAGASFGFAMQASTWSGYYSLITRTRYRAAVWFGSFIIALAVTVVAAGLILTDPDRLLLPGFAIFILVNCLHHLMSSALVRAWRKEDSEGRQAEPALPDVVG